jgi:hypothetical protein
MKYVMVWVRIDGFDHVPTTDSKARKLMPTTKRIVVLANSIKHYPARCVAGREVTGFPGTTARVDAWVRPVSTEGEGELQSRQLIVAGGGAIDVFDIVDVTLKSPGGDAAQPENWIIEDSQPWRRIGKWSIQRIADLAERPRDLWLEPTSDKTDRASAGHVLAHPPSQSLFFLALSEAYICQDSRKRYRLQFTHAGTDYDLGVTDPLVRDRLVREYGGQNSLSLTGVHVCISLAPAFKGHHYKIIATMVW